MTKPSLLKIELQPHISVEKADRVERSTCAHTMRGQRILHKSIPTFNALLKGTIQISSVITSWEFYKFLVFFSPE